MTTYNDSKRIDIQPDLDLHSSKTVSTDSELSQRILRLKLVGQQLLDSIEPQLDALQPGRKRTPEESSQVCMALALFVEYLMQSDGNVDVESGGAQVAGQNGSGSDLGGRDDSAGRAADPQDAALDSVGDLGSDLPKL